MLLRYALFKNRIVANICAFETKATFSVFKIDSDTPPYMGIFNIRAHSALASMRMVNSDNFNTLTNPSVFEFLQGGFGLVAHFFHCVFFLKTLSLTGGPALIYNPRFAGSPVSAERVRFLKLLPHHLNPYRHFLSVSLGKGMNHFVGYR